MGYPQAGKSWHFNRKPDGRVSVRIIPTPDERREILYFVGDVVCGGITRYEPSTLMCDAIECSDCGRLLEVKLS